MKFYDRVKETSTTTGTGAITLLGAVAGFQSFSLYSVGESFYYAITNGTTEWENGTGVRTSTGFTRTPSSSSNGGALVNFSAGTKDVFVTVGASFLNGQSISELTAAPATIPDTYLFELQDPATGLSYKVTYAALKAAFGGAADTSVPALTSASVSNIGTTTATGNVTVGEANGTLYCLATTGSTATQTAVEASTFTQAITTTGAKSINVTGLTAGAAQYLHFMHKDAAGNKTPVLSASFTTNSAAVPATGVALTGPTTGAVSVASTNFTVGVTPVGGTITGTVVVTPSDSGGGGTFSPTSVSLTTASPSATFTYTPSATAGARSITVTNNGSLTNPAAITYTSTAAAVTAYTITGQGTTPNAVKDTYDASAVTINSGKRVIRAGLFTNGNTYINITPNPVSAVSGWSNSATVPPEILADPTTNTAVGGARVNGAVPMTKPAAYSSDSYLNVPTGSGTSRWWLWVLPDGGAWFLFNPSGVEITGA